MSFESPRDRRVAVLTGLVVILLGAVLILYYLVAFNRPTRTITETVTVTPSATPTPPGASPNRHPEVLILDMPPGFPDVAVFCDGPIRVYVGRGDNRPAPIRHPSCPG